MTTNKTNVALSDITGNGARLKALVETALSFCDGLSIHTTNADDADNYSVDLSWDGNEDWLFRIYNSNAYAYVCYLTKAADGSYVEKDSDYMSILSNGSLVVEVNQSDYDMLILAFTKSGSMVNLACFKVVDQFTGAERVVATVGSNYNEYYSFSDFYVTDGTFTVACYADKNANGLTPNGIAAAIPIVFYTESSDLPMSGIVAGGELLYFIFQGTTQKYFDQRFTAFTIGGHDFCSLMRNYCVKTT